MMAVLLGMVVILLVVFPVTITSKYPYTVSGAFPGGGDALEQLTLMSFVAAKSQQLRLITAANDERGRAEDLFLQAGVGQQRRGVCRK